MKNISNKLISTLLTLTIVFGLFAATPLTVHADFAAVVGGELATFKVFQKVNTYTYGQFADVNENDWYGSNKQGAVANAFEYGLMKGTDSSTFNPTGDMTIADAITIAARVHSIYNGGSGEFVQGSPWYQVYVDYAIDKKITTAGNFPNYEKAATRAEMAHIFARTSVPVTLAINEMNGPANTVNVLPDVNSTTPYHEDIVKLYEAGILTGSDTQGTFHPNSSITRAEAAAIIARVILLDARVSGRTYG